MVASMRHWGNATGIVFETPGSNLIHTTEVGSLLFGKEGVDPYMEYSATLWFLHWQLASTPQKTSWYWCFNKFSGLSFQRETLVRGLEKLSIERKWARTSTNTIKRDVECFVRTYAARSLSEETSYEDALESPLTELRLIKSIGRRDGFQFMRGPKITLGDGIFVFALMHFWSRFQSSNVLSFEAVLYEPGSPGRVFLLDEDNLINRLVNIEEIACGAIRWSETAGMKQLLRSASFTYEEALKFLKSEYSPPVQQRVAL